MPIARPMSVTGQTHKFSLDALGVCSEPCHQLMVRRALLCEISCRHLAALAGGIVEVTPPARRLRRLIDFVREVCIALSE